MNIIDDFIKLDMDAPQIAERTEKDLAFNRKVKSCYDMYQWLYKNDILRKEAFLYTENSSMSACYTIELNMKFKSPESMSDAVRSLQEYIKKDAETDYDLESYAADGIGTENIDDLMKIFLSDRKRQRITITDSGEWKNYSADFNASYGWESVLVKMFKILGVYLANGSQLDISIDNDYNGLVIRNGICKQINLKGEEEKSL